MLFVRPQRACLFFLTGKVLQIHAFPADGAPNSLLPAFTLINGNGGSETGRCTGAELDNLKASYEDMCLMARAADDELGFLMTQAAATQGDGPPRPKDNSQPGADDWKRWDKVRQTYLSLFGSDPFGKRSDAPGPVGPGQEIPGHKRKVMNFYQSIVNDFCSGTGPAGVTQYLVCTDAHYKFITAGTPDPGDAQGQNIETTHPQCRNVGGIWYSPNMPVAFQYYAEPPPESPSQGPICVDRDHTLAVTMLDWRAIVFCEPGLGTSIMDIITIQDLRSGIKPTTRRYRRKEDRTSVTQALRAGHVAKLEEIKKGGQQMMPLTWLHELNHLVLKSRDQPAVKRGGERIKTTDREWNDITNQWEDKEVDAKAYGYELARNLALDGSGAGGLANPDNAAFFALAMFFGEYDWSRGFAMPLRDPSKSDD